MSGELLWKNKDILILEDDEIVRILNINDSDIEIISISKLNMPFYTKKEMLINGKALSEQEMLKIVQRFIPDEQELSEKQKDKMWQRYKDFVVTAKSAEGYEVDTIKMVGQDDAVETSLFASADGTYAFTMPSQDVSINATFIKKTF
ncbi:MAG: hypothetical protein K6B14_11225, partial [Lachnospiraceae bacterium]|nr:hypothetical protein [Lachnospiraceae bacterium]